MKQNSCHYFSSSTSTSLYIVLLYKAKARSKTKEVKRNVICGAHSGEDDIEKIQTNILFYGDPQGQRQQQGWITVEYLGVKVSCGPLLSPQGTLCPNPFSNCARRKGICICIIFAPAQFFLCSFVLLCSLLVNVSLPTCSQWQCYIIADGNLQAFLGFSPA